MNGELLNLITYFITDYCTYDEVDFAELTAVVNRLDIICSVDELEELMIGNFVSLWDIQRNVVYLLMFEI